MTEQSGTTDCNDPTPLVNGTEDEEKEGDTEYNFRTVLIIKYILTIKTVVLRRPTFP